MDEETFRTCLVCQAECEWCVQTAASRHFTGINENNTKLWLTRLTHTDLDIKSLFVIFICCFSWKTNLFLFLSSFSLLPMPLSLNWLILELFAKRVCHFALSMWLIHLKYWVMQHGHMFKAVLPPSLGILCPC